MKITVTQNKPKPAAGATADAGDRVDGECDAEFDGGRDDYADRGGGVQRGGGEFLVAEWGYHNGCDDI